MPAGIDWRRVQLYLPILFAVAYLTPAFINGFPLVYWDTGGYLIAGVEDDYVPNRSSFYAWFLEYAGDQSVWLIIIIQSAVAAFLMAATVRALAPEKTWAPLAALALACLTSLPWYASWLMPDLFSGIAVLATLMLAFGAISNWAATALVLLLIYSMVVHTSHFPLVVATLAGAGLSAMAFRCRLSWKLPLACIAVAIALTVLVNDALTGRPFFNRTGWVLLFARMAEGGLVQRVLDEHCSADPESDWSKLCPYRADIPRNAEQWLWERGTPFWRIGDWEGTRYASRRVVLLAIREYPLESAEFALRGFLQQLVKVELGEGTESQEWFLRWTVRAAFPEELQPWRQALQQQGKLLPIARVVNKVHMPVVLAAIAFTLVGIFSPRLPRPLRAACLTMVLAFLANAFVCGALSGPHDRYAVRLVWAMLATGVPVAFLLIRPRRA